jgi:hypothetical protein
VRRGREQGASAGECPDVRALVLPHLVPVAMHRHLSSVHLTQIYNALTITRWLSQNFKLIKVV